jgi:hypothetical protein
MEWLVPILFVLVSVAQWWVRRRQVLPPSPSPTQEAPEPAQSTDPLEEFGDLLEALGRRRHESPPIVPKTGNATPPRILPPLEPITPSFTTSVEMANRALPPIALHQDALPNKSKFQKTNKDPYSLKSIFRGSATDWSRAVVLSEVLAPPVALR